MYITIRPSLEKVKAWHKVKDAEALYNSLIANRAIDPADLDIYKVTCGSNELEEKGAYALIENNTKIEFYKTCIIEGTDSVLVDWNDLSQEAHLLHYEQAELDDIEFNLGEPDDTTWRVVPQASITVPTYTEDTELVQTICIEKLNPFT